jgi:hypothetical protein
VEDGGTIYATENSRTKLRISIKGRSDDEVILPEDKVSISAFVGDDIQELTVEGQSDGSLMLQNPGFPGDRGGVVRRGHYRSVGATVFTFADFKNAFHPAGSVIKSTRQGRQPVDQVRFNGMRWERQVRECRQ